MNVSEAMERGAEQGFVCFAIPGEKEGEPAVLYAVLPIVKLGEHIVSDDLRTRIIAYAGAMTALRLHAETAGMEP